MNMGASYWLGLLVGMLFAALLVRAFAKKLHKNGEKKDRYDERQQILIGKGYKYGFYGILFYNAFYAAAGSWLGSSLFEPGPAAFMNICIGLIVFAAYCIWNGAYFALNYRSNRYIILLIVLTVINYGAGISFLLGGVPMIENGLLTTSATNFMCAGLLTVILLLLLIRKLVPVKDEDEDDEEEMLEDEISEEKSAIEMPGRKDTDSMPEKNAVDETLEENTPDPGNSNDKEQEEHSHRTASDESNSSDNRQEAHSHRIASDESNSNNDRQEAH